MTHCCAKTLLLNSALISCSSCSSRCKHISRRPSSPPRHAHGHVHALPVIPTPPDYGSMSMSMSMIMKKKKLHFSDA
ncbi:hypothetical protein M758_3G207400 [Ceratodon purpureus]|nr:hypothetical protein M758_3G207400 [Ceratodon purpureus]